MQHHAPGNRRGFDQRVHHRFKPGGDVPVAPAQALPGNGPDGLFGQRRRSAVGVAPEGVFIQSDMCRRGMAFPGSSALRGLGVAVAASVQIAGVERGHQAGIVLLRRQTVLHAVSSRQQGVFRQIAYGRIDGQIAGDVPVVQVAPLAAQHVQMQQVRDHVFQKGALPWCGQQVEAGGVHRQDRDAVADGYAGRLP